MSPPSKPTGAQVEVAFINTRAESVELIWIGPDGSQKSYSTLQQDARFSIRTRPGAIWLIRDARQQPLGHFIVEDKPGKVAKAVIPVPAD